MFFGFESGWMKVWIGFVLSMLILLCTDMSTPLSYALLNRIAFDDLIFVKALMGSILLCLLFFSFLWAKQSHASPLKQIKKVLQWQTALKELEKSCFSAEIKMQILKTLSKEMHSDLDLVAHYLHELTQIEMVDDYKSSFEYLKRLLEVYSKTLSDGYYRSKYYSMGGG